MKYGIISDIHSNYAALKVVLNELVGVDKIICAGDIVGYGPQPNECIKTFKDYRIQSVVGNHDLACIGRKELNWFNDYAISALIWTEGILTDENKKYLSSLPEIIKKSDFIVVHGSLRDNINEYIFNEDEANATFELLNERLCFVGHTHLPCIFRQNNQITIGIIEDFDTIKLDDHKKNIVNPGSVGQPRDGNPKASFAIFDSVTEEITLRRVEYPIEETQQLMKEAKLPQFLINRLKYRKITKGGKR